MVNDLVLIALFFSDRNIYQDYNPYIRKGALSKEAKIILKDLGIFYGENTVEEKVNIDKFATWFKQVQHPELNDTQSELYTKLFENVAQQEIKPDDEFTKSILTHFKKEDFKSRIKKHIENGFDSSTVKKIVEQYEKEADPDPELEFAPNSLQKILKQEVRNVGLHWRLNCLETSVGPIIKGDFGVVAAFVETGKTSFLASEVAHMAGQLSEGNVLWFNNEQTNDRVQKRIWCAALGVSEDELESAPEKYEVLYTEFMQGDVNRVKVYDCYGFSISSIAKEIKLQSPALVIIDMIDHLTFKGDSENADWRRLQKLYYEVRHLARFCPVIGATQCNASVTWFDYEEQKEKFQHYITMKQLAGSGQGKQEAMDFLITIGKDTDYPKTRYIHVPKNKLPGDGNSSHRYIKSECTFDEHTSRYIDHKF